MRVLNTLRNAFVGITMQVLLLVASFATRTVFANVLTAEYLGVESVFADIINMLSIAELGFATAVMYILYKPIREKDYAKINSIMRLYRNVYAFIGIFIFVGGLIVLPLVQFIVTDIPTVNENLYLVFIIYLTNSVVSYFFSYKQALITANQQDYIVQIWLKGIAIIAHGVEIIVLLTTANFIYYLLVRTVSVILTNLILARKADQLFPYLDIKNAMKLSKQEIIEIRKNIGAMFLHKIGIRIVYSTDNIFISIFSSVANAGLYSNYDLINKNLAVLIDMVLNASIASVGDLRNDEDNAKSEEIFQHLFFLNFILYGFSAVVLLVIMNDFIGIWLNAEYLFSTFTLGLIVANFYIHGMRRSVIIFRDAWGLFYHDRFKPILEIVANISLQTILGHIYGLNGIIAGTSLTILLTGFWIEPLVLYKHGFNEHVSKFFKSYTNYLVKFILLIIATTYIMSFYQVNNWGTFFIKAILTAFLTGIFLLILVFKEKSFKFYISLLKQMLQRR